MPERSHGEQPTLLLDGSNAVEQLRAVSLIRSGGLVVLPTDTGYGIAASLFAPASVERVYAIKQRDPSLRLPVLLATAADLPMVVSAVPSLGWKLIGRFWPGPLSLVLPATSNVPRAVTGGLGTVAVRVPGARSCLSVLQSLGEPVTGTSANISGRPSARTADEAFAQLGGLVDAILVDDAAVVHGAASTVVEIGKEGMILHRTGVVSIDELRVATSARVTPVRALPARNDGR